MIIEGEITHVDDNWIWFNFKAENLILPVHFVRLLSELPDKIDFPFSATVDVDILRWIEEVAAM